MRKFLLIFLLCWLSTSNAASNFVFSNDQGPYAVGLRVVQQYDYSRSFKGRTDVTTGQPTQGERARPIQTLVWYPAQKDGNPVTYLDYVLTASTEEEFDRSKDQVSQTAKEWLKKFSTSIGTEQINQETSHRMWAIRDAKPVAGKFPLIVYAPGFNGPAHENVEVCEYLASQGYVVLASPNMGSRTRGMTHDLEGIEAQVGDIEYLIGYAQSLPQADTAHIAVVGYSWGGISNVFAAAKDSRIVALVNLDGSVRVYPKLIADAKYVTPARVAIPMLFLASRPWSFEDVSKSGLDVSDSFLNKMKYSELYMVTMFPMTHLDFPSIHLRFAPASRFTDYSREEVSLAYSWMARYIHQFLNAYLKSDAASLAFMNNSPANNAVPTHLLSVEIHHSVSKPPTIEVLAGELAKRGFEHAVDVYQELHTSDENFKPEAELLNNWGYKLLRQQRIKESIAIFRLATTIYPESSNAFDSLGEAYERDNNNALAIKSYQRSLALAPNNDNAVQHLKFLGVSLSHNSGK